MFYVLLFSPIRVTSLGRMNMSCTMHTESFPNTWYRTLFHEARHTLLQSTLVFQVMLVLPQQVLPPILQLLSPVLQTQQEWPPILQV